MKKKVLILGVAAVQMDAILELKDMGYETYACAMAKDGPGAEVADHFDIIDILDEESIIKHIQDNGISAVYSVGSDLAMPVACSISQKLQLPQFVSSDTARICNNKNLMRTTLGKSFKGNVPFQILESKDAELELDFPLIIKPADAQGQRGVKLVRNYHDYIEGYTIAKQYSRSGLVIAEKYISGSELSVNGYVVNGEIKFLLESDRETWPQYIGLIHKHIVPSKSFSEETKEEMAEIIKEACKKLEINNGPVYAQMKLEEGKPYIIEITPRLDGCHMWRVLSYYTGVNLLKLTFQHLLEGDVSELNNQSNDINNEYILEFICQEPNTAADYSGYEDKTEKALYSFNYYKQGEIIRPVNGKYEKIGYFINKKTLI